MPLANRHIRIYKNIRRKVVQCKKDILIQYMQYFHFSLRWPWPDHKKLAQNIRTCGWVPTLMEFFDFLHGFWSEWWAGEWTGKEKHSQSATATMYRTLREAWSQASLQASWCHVSWSWSHAWAWVINFEIYVYIYIYIYICVWVWVWVWVVCSMKVWISWK